MLTEKDAQDLMIKLIDLRNKEKSSDDPKISIELKKHEQKCITEFKYLVTMKTSRYKSFSNYEDLNQEGFEALLMAMKNYNPKKGSWFWWAHKYIDTRIARSANLHTTIRYPLKVAKNNTPHKESIMPLLIEERYCPDIEFENFQNLVAVEKAMSALSEQQKQVINLTFGLDNDKPMSINSVCKKLNMSRLNCIKTMNSAISLIKEKMEI